MVELSLRNKTACLCYQLVCGQFNFSSVRWPVRVSNETDFKWTSDRQTDRQTVSLTSVSCGVTGVPPRPGEMTSLLGMEQSWGRALQGGGASSCSSSFPTSTSLWEKEEPPQHTCATTWRAISLKPCQRPLEAAVFITDWIRKLHMGVLSETCVQCHASLFSLVLC